jgi:4a-hydroxytetrahydrobiopterin dehydratase
MDLKAKKCVVCQVGAPTLKGKELEKYLKAVDSEWKLYDNKAKIKRDFEFEDFKEALAFANKVGELAEEEGHHPNIYLHDYKKVQIELWTHKIGGLHENDFILASKIDDINY